MASFALDAQESQPASWVAHPGITGHEYGVYRFRKTFDLQAVPKQFRVQVSADNRYRLYVNGVSLLAGHSAPI